MTGPPMSTTRTSPIFSHFSVPATAPIASLLTLSSPERNRWASRHTHLVTLSLPGKSRGGGVPDPAKREERRLVSTLNCNNS